MSTAKANDPAVEAESSEAAVSESPEPASEPADNVHRIERTKATVSETVARARGVMNERLGTARERFQDVAEEMGERYQDVSAGAQRAREMAREQYAVRSEQFREGYTRVRHDVDDVVEDVNDYVRTNPGKSILIAAGAGFLLGLLFRPRRRR